MKLGTRFPLDLFARLDPQILDNHSQDVWLALAPQVIAENLGLAFLFVRTPHGCLASLAAISSSTTYFARLVAWLVTHVA